LPVDLQSPSAFAVVGVGEGAVRDEVGEQLRAGAVDLGQGHP